MARLVPIPLSAIETEPARLSDAPFFIVAPAPAEAEPFDGEPRTLSTVRTNPLLAVDEPARLLVWPIPLGARIKLGRSRAKTDITVSDSRVSSLHAAIDSRARDKIYIVDLSSSNGTFVDGRCLAPGEAGAALLRPGIVIKLAEIELRFLGPEELKQFAARRRMP
jgi:hypothetical protein